MVALAPAALDRIAEAAVVEQLQKGAAEIKHFDAC
jgi:hypothetical protein